MSLVRRHRWLTFFAVVLLTFVIATGGFGLYLAGEAGQLPWQVDPTRIPITPFADIPGFSAPTAVPTATSTPTPTY
jgi:hypothetical protein